MPKSLSPFDLASGLLLSGAAGTPGQVPTKQSDGSVAWATPAGGAPTANIWAAGNYVQPIDTIVNPGTTCTANIIYLFPFVTPRSIRINELAARVTTAISGSFSLAIYGSNSSGLFAGAPLAFTGSISSATTQASAGAVSPANLLSTDLLWMAANTSASGVAFQKMDGSSTYHSSVLGSPTLATVTSSGSGSTIGWRVSQAFGTWPNLDGASYTVVAGDNRAPLIYPRIDQLL